MISATFNVMLVIRYQSGELTWERISRGMGVGGVKVGWVGWGW